MEASIITALSNKIFKGEHLTTQELQALASEADYTCQRCDGYGIFYGNLCVCTCIVEEG
jgi:hypothetical protein